MNVVTTLVLILSLISGLVACSTESPLAPEGPTIREIYDGHRSALNTDMSVIRAMPTVTRDQKPVAVQRTERRFSRLYNPSLHLYIYPHLAGREQVPIPGYYTVFPLYPRIEYARAGEPVVPQ